MADESAGHVSLDLVIVDKTQAAVEQATRAISDKMEQAAQRGRKALDDAWGKMPPRMKEPIKPVDPQSIELATDAIDLMEQKVANTTAQIERQREVMAQLLTEAKSGGGAELDAQIESAQGRLLSLQQTAMSTQAALDKAIAAPGVAAEKAAAAAQRAQERATAAAQREQEKVAAAAERAQQRAAQAAEQTRQNVTRAVDKMGTPIKKFGLSIKRALVSALEALDSVPDLVAHRYEKFRGMGVFESGELRVESGPNG